jgi:quinolinate synthase
MADMAQLDDVLDAWQAITEAHAGVADFTLVPITYMNSSAAIKSFVGEHGGAVCTSSNCEKILRWALDGSGLRKVIFFPDQHLGRNTAFKMGYPLDSMLTWDYRQPAGGFGDEQIRAATFYLWKGHCSVHQLFRPEHVDQARAKFPGIKVIVHPECRYEVVQKADLAGSTDLIGKTIAAAAPGTSWAIGTEVHMVNRLAKAHPDKHITILSECQCLCTTMYRIDPPHLLWVLDNLVEGRVVNEIIVDDRTKYWAKVALNRMLDITAGVPVREPEGTPPPAEPPPRTSLRVLAGA